MLSFWLNRTPKSGFRLHVTLDLHCSISTYYCMRLLSTCSVASPKSYVPKCKIHIGLKDLVPKKHVKQLIIYNSYVEIIFQKYRVKYITKIFTCFFFLPFSMWLLENSHIWFTLDFYWTVPFETICLEEMLQFPTLFPFILINRKSDSKFVHVFSQF